MLSVDLPLRSRSGETARLTDAGRAGQFGLPRVAEELYQSARRFRVFTASRVSVRLERVVGVVTWPAGEVERKLKEGKPLLGVWAYSTDRTNLAGVRTVPWTDASIAGFIDSL